MKDYEYVAQHYIPNPFLIDNKKFDFRLYLMIKGVENMEAFIASEGMVRFCTEEYTDPQPKEDSDSDEEEELFGTGKPKDNLMGHLTNYCLNKESDKYVNNNNFQNSDNGTKRLLSNVLKVLGEMGVDIEKFNEELKDIWTKLVMAMRPSMVNTYHYEIGREGLTNQNCFHLLGLDLMMDMDHKLWVLEINSFPSFNFFFDRIEVDPISKKKKRVKTISELDKYLKTLIMKEAFLIWRGEGEESKDVFQKVFPPKNPEKYCQFTIYDDIRKAFEKLAEPQNPDYLSQAQFEAISELSDSRLGELTGNNYKKSFGDGGDPSKKPGKYEYNSKLLTRSLLRNYYKQFAKWGNKSMMNLSQFTKALDGLAKTLYPAFYTKYERLSRITEELFMR